jgi:hypothetical protein
MKRFIHASSAIALGAMLLITTPAMAEGKADKARAAIAEASGKIDAAIRVGTDGDALAIQSQAQDALVLARKELADGHKDEAIIDAQHASKLADTAIAEVSRTRAANASAQRARSEAVTSGAMQSAANANARADVAQQTAAIAGAEADAANARAAAQPSVVYVTPPASTTATVSTETTQSTSVAPARVVTPARKHRIVHRKRSARTQHTVVKRTMTTTTTQPN